MPTPNTKNGVFSRNLCKQQKPFFFLVYLVLHILCWQHWCGRHIFTLLGQWITRIWCLLSTPCDSLSSSNPNGFYSGNAGEFRDVKRKGEEEVPTWWNAIYKRITRIWKTSTSRYQYYNIVIAPICCTFKYWWLLNRLTSMCVFLLLYIISYTLRCFWPHSFLFGFKFFIFTNQTF